MSVLAVHDFEHRCAVLAQIIRESPFTGRIVRDDLFPFPCDSAGQFLRLVCLRFSHQPSVCKAEGFLRQQLKRLENWHRNHECSVSYRLMKQLDWKSFTIGVLLTTTVMFGTGAATNTTDKWDAKQKWEIKTSSGKIPEGWEPFAYDSNDKFDPFLLRRRIR